jgi:hypothetical protein
MRRTSEIYLRQAGARLGRHVERIGDIGLDSLSAIYHRRFSEVASQFGLQIADLSRDSASIGLPRTHLLGRMEEPETENVSLPVGFKPGFRFEKTNLLARVVEKWDEVPLVSCNISTCANPCMDMWALRTSRFSRSSAPVLSSRLTRAKERSVPTNGKRNTSRPSTLRSCATASHRMARNSISKVPSGQPKSLETSETMQL